MILLVVYIVVVGAAWYVPHRHLQVQIVGVVGLYLGYLTAKKYAK